VLACGGLQSSRSKKGGSGMNRRKFIGIMAAAATVLPVAAGAQQPVRIAMLGSGSAGSSELFVDAFRDGLREHGLVEGQHYVLDARWAEGVYTRFPQLAAEVAAQRPA
jgi:putative ABC transport system substrate-binding protein